MADSKTGWGETRVKSGTGLQLLSQSLVQDGKRNLNEVQDGLVERATSSRITIIRLRMVTRETSDSCI